MVHEQINNLYWGTGICGLEGPYSFCGPREYKTCGCTDVGLLPINYLYNDYCVYNSHHKIPRPRCVKPNVEPLFKVKKSKHSHDSDSE